MILGDKPPHFWGGSVTGGIGLTGWSGRWRRRSGRPGWTRGRGGQGGARGVRGKEKERKGGAWAWQASILTGHDGGERRGGSRHGAPRDEQGRGACHAVGFGWCGWQAGPAIQHGGAVQNLISNLNRFKLSSNYFKPGLTQKEPSQTQKIWNKI
jgi:hypothetical protein